MNYLPFVSWGMYGGTTAAERAHFFVSWGLMASLPNMAAKPIMVIVQLLHRLFV